MVSTEAPGMKQIMNTVREPSARARNAIGMPANITSSVAAP